MRPWASGGVLHKRKQNPLHFQSVTTHGRGYLLNSCLIEYSKDFHEYMPTRKYEDTCSAMEFIEEFENESFWDELIDRLAERDTIREVGEAGFKALKPIVRITKVEELRIPVNLTSDSV